MRRVGLVAVGLAALASAPLACSSGGGSSGGGGKTDGGAATGGKGGKGGSGGSPSCSGAETCTVPGDCFPISCICPGMSTSFQVPPSCTAGCCGDLKATCDAACADGGGLGGNGGTGGAAGAGGASCNLPDGGVGEVIATKLCDWTFAFDASNVYFCGSSSTDQYNLAVAPADGGAATILVAGAAAHRIAVDADNVYYIEGKTGAVMSVPKAGGTPTELRPGGCSPGPGTLILDSVNLYGGDTCKSEIFSIPLAGGPAVSVAGAEVDDLATDGVYLYYANFFGVDRIPVGGGTKTTLASPGGVYALALDAGTVYYGAENAVWKIAAAGGTPSKLGDTPIPGFPASIAVNAPWLYSASDDPCSGVYRFPLSGGSATPVALFSHGVTKVATHAGYVYFIPADVPPNVAIYRVAE